MAIPSGMKPEELAAIAGPNANDAFMKLMMQSDVGDSPSGLVAPNNVGAGLHNIGVYINQGMRNQARAAERKDMMGLFGGAAAANQAATSSLMQSAGAGPSGAPPFVTGGASAAPKPVAPMASLPGPAPQQKPMAPTPDSVMGPVDAPSAAPKAPSFATGLKSVPDTGSTAPPIVDLRGTGGPASIRNNNPGAMYPGPSATKFGSTAMHVIGGGHKIAEFPDAQSGAAAQFDLLDRNYAGMPVSQAITKWSGGNSSPSYIASVSKDLGLDQNAVLTHDMLRNPKVAVPFARSMARVEAGRDYPLDDAGWNAAHARAFGSTTPNAQVADASGTTVPGGSPMATPPPMSGGVPAGITPRSVQSVPVPRGFAGQALPSAPAPAPAQAQQAAQPMTYDGFTAWANGLRSDPAYLRMAPEQRQVLEGIIASKDPMAAQSKDLANRKMQAEIGKLEAQVANGGSEQGKTGTVFQGKDGNYYGVQWNNRGQPSVYPLAANGQALTPSKGTDVVGDVVIDKATGKEIRNVGQNIAAGKVAEGEGKNVVEARGDLPEAKRRTELAVSSLENLKNTAMNLANHKGLDAVVGGLYQAYAPNVSEDARNAGTELENVKVKISGAVLQAMRDASKTGGAVGNVTEREWPRLENMIANLDPKQGKEQFLQNLNQVIAYADNVSNQIKQAYESQAKIAGSAPTFLGGAQPSQPKNQYYEKYQGIE